MQHIKLLGKNDDSLSNIFFQTFQNIVWRTRSQFSFRIAVSKSVSDNSQKDNWGEVFFKLQTEGIQCDTFSSKVSDWRLHSYQKKTPLIVFPNKFLECFQKIYSIKTTQKVKFSIKGALSGLRQFLAAESPLKMMKNAFYITLKTLFVLKIFKFLSRLFDHVEKRFD